MAAVLGVGLMDARVNALVISQINGAAQQPIILAAPVSSALGRDPLR
jgi:hypothetical protein